MNILYLLVPVLLLTALTQVGGLLLLLSLPLLHLIHAPSLWQQSLWRGAAFLLIYALCVFAIVPALARLGGRTPLPCFASDAVPLQAANVGYCLLMRNYVTPRHQSPSAARRPTIPAGIPRQHGALSGCQFPVHGWFPAAAPFEPQGWQEA